MRRLSLLLTTALVAGTTATSGAVEAAPIGASGVRAAADSLRLAQTVQQFVYDGHEYCWYDNGWNGAGWYWCDYATRSGVAGAAVPPGASAAAGTTAADAVGVAQPAE